MRGAAYCGATGGRGKLRQSCCSSEGAASYGDCDDAKRPEGPAFAHVGEFASSEKKWLQSYLKAWKISTNNGQPSLKYLNGNVYDPKDLSD